MLTSILWDSLKLLILGSVIDLTRRIFYWIVDRFKLYVTCLEDVTNTYPITQAGPFLLNSRQETFRKSGLSITW
jgi:hypothetical protein